jgi:hypothetical protein
MALPTSGCAATSPGSTRRPGRSLEGALKQLMLYALPLENPPLLVVSDRLRIEVHTHFTGTPSECHVFALEDLADAELQQRLRTLWTAARRLAPAAQQPRHHRRSRAHLCRHRRAAARGRRGARAGEPLPDAVPVLLLCRRRGPAARAAVRAAGGRGDHARAAAQPAHPLFETMRDGGLFGVDDLPWFNGGLFKTIAVPPLAAADVAALKAASALNWSAIDPSIFGTLFERGLDPAKRAAAGRQLHRPGHHPAAGGAGGAAPAAGRMGQRPGWGEGTHAAARRAASATATRPGGTRRPPSSAFWSGCAATACWTRPAAAATSSTWR